MISQNHTPVQVLHLSEKLKPSEKVTPLMKAFEKYFQKIYVTSHTCIFLFKEGGIWPLHCLRDSMGLKRQSSFKWLSFVWHYIVLTRFTLPLKYSIFLYLPYTYLIFVFIFKKNLMYWTLWQQPFLSAGVIHTPALTHLEIWFWRWPGIGPMWRLSTQPWHILNGAVLPGGLYMLASGWTVSSLRIRTLSNVSSPFFFSGRTVG